MNDELNAVVNGAINIYRVNGRKAYKWYTDEVVRLIKSEFPLTKRNFEYFNARMKTNRAKLSQLIGAASKNAKAHIIVYSATKMSTAEDLDLSNREAILIIKHAAKRAIATPALKKLFHRDNSEQFFSPYFSDREYRTKVHNHTLVKELKILCKQYDKRKPKLTNTKAGKAKIAKAKEGK